MKTPTGQTQISEFVKRHAARLRFCAIGSIFGASIPLGALAAETTLDHLKPISASVGVSAFQEFCGKTKGRATKVKRALQSDQNYSLGHDPYSKVLALHKADAIQVSVTSDNICSVFFLTKAEPGAATKAATEQLKKLKVINGSGKKMTRFRTDYKSSLGTVIILNHALLSIEGMEIALSR